VKSGYPVIVDATFLKRSHRDRFRKLAQRLGVPFTILDFQADTVLLRARILRRSREEKDASEATLAVLDHQLADQEPLAADERPWVVTIESGRETLPLDRIIQSG